jgi:hypothetical protein
MDFSYYKPSPREEQLYRFYIRNRIYYPEDMDIFRIAEICKTHLHFYDGIPTTDQPDNGMPIILLDIRKSEPERRKNFFHELGHVFKHVGDQEKMHKPFLKLQENQADRFGLYASLPIYMLGDILRDVYTHESFEKNVAEQFNLPIEHVRKRLEQINNRIFLRHQDEEIKRRQASAEVTEDSFKLFLEDHKRQFGERYGGVNGKTISLL